ncbi:MAG TPA: sulfatase-like hydrolase/transferase [Haliscomenobacter sp.]|uniref:sulfatase-like hydrolase/transferase n=1 Tax=Haliscomenobacter sp. TaxID=2717303 RepID=UPI002CB40BC9|nr:sulfatase-like hydrolase/transferase [Haliscomenobacter sp.]HOY16242.1 sulfatase-like hydrolase/transferase [Haliscomenobacter sp.]
MLTRNLLLLLLILCSAQSIAKPKPNIVFIFSDDLSFRDLSCYGQKVFQTPNLDALAQQSTRFTQAYAPAPECAPTRGCMLTGLHVGRSPIRINSSARGFESLPADSYTFPKFLKKNGYHNAVIGKWGIGYDHDSGNPLKQGFDYHFGYLDHYEAHSYFPRHLYENGKKVEYASNQRFNIQDLYNKERKAQNAAEYESQYNPEGKLRFMAEEKGVYAVDEIEKKALAFIQQQGKKPFFLYYTTNLPHGPSIVDDLRGLKTHPEMNLGSREWAAMVQRLDVSVGRLIEQLKASGVYENTLIIFASDNGYAMHNPQKASNGTQHWPDDPWLNNKGPFKGGKFSVWEAGMRIPLFIHLPNQTQAQTISQPVWLLDLFPTFAAMLGKSAPAGLDGYSLWPLLQGKASRIPADRPFYFYKNNEQAVRKGAWFAHREHPQQALQLYLLEEDQKCEHDLAALFPGVVRELEQYLNTVHQPHPWYWNPGETAEDFQKKRDLARSTGQIVQPYRPNGLSQMPWEKNN